MPALQPSHADLFIKQLLRLNVVVVFFSAGKPVNSLFVSPAVTPIKSVLEPYSNNPAFRMYLYSSDDHGVLVRIQNEK